jgi:hypothetical protein
MTMVDRQSQGSLSLDAKTMSKSSSFTVIVSPAINLDEIDVVYFCDRRMHLNLKPLLHVKRPPSLSSRRQRHATVATLSKPSRPSTTLQPSLSSLHLHPAWSRSSMLCLLPHDTRPCISLNRSG